MTEQDREKLTNLYNAIDNCNGVPIGYPIIRKCLIPLVDYLKEELNINDGKDVPETDRV